MRDIKPKTITHLCCLITGDRFYCWSDTKKIVWQLKMHTSILINGVYKKFSLCINDAGQKHRFDANRVVMFLTRTKPIVRRKKEFLIDRYFA